MTDNSKRIDLFDKWSKHYSNCANVNEFPFIGFKSHLLSVATHCAISDKTTVLELGIGTGLLAMLYADRAKKTAGVDFSVKMLKLCKQNIPGIQLFNADVTKDFDFLCGEKFDRIVTNYLFHEFDDPTKNEIVKRCFENHLSESGFMVIGDISFENQTILDDARQKSENLWDGQEFYWNAEKQTEALRELGFFVLYEQTTPCSGVYIISRQ